MTLPGEVLLASLPRNPQWNKEKPVNDPQAQEMIEKLSAERVRLVHAGETQRAEIVKLRRQVDALTEALAGKAAPKPKGRRNA